MLLKMSIQYYKHNIHAFIYLSNAIYVCIMYTTNILMLMFSILKDHRHIDI